MPGVQLGCNFKLRPNFAAIQLSLTHPIAPTFRKNAYLAQNLNFNIMAKDKSPSKEKDKKAPVKNLKEKRAEKKVKKTAKKSNNS